MNSSHETDRRTINETISKEYVSTSLIVLMRSFSFVIIVLNVFVIICLNRKKRTFPKVVWLQIVCITLNDICAGLGSFIMSFVDWPFFGEHLYSCCFIIGFFLATQCATLYNILAICINRFIAIKGLRKNENLWKDKYTVYGSVAAWLSSFILCSAPFILWTNEDSFNRDKFCSMKSMFGEQADSSMKILLGSFLVPLVLTDIFYSLIFVRLKRELRRMTTLRPKHSIDSVQLQGLQENSITVEPCLQDIQDDEIFIRTYRSQSCQTETSFDQNPQNDQNPQITTDNKSNPRSSLNSYIDIDDSVCDKKADDKAVIHQSITMKYADESGTKVSFDRPDIGESWTPQGSKMRKGTQVISIPALRIRRAFLLLGCILIALNIFSWPGVVALTLGSQLGSPHFSRSLILPLFTSLSLNSVTNPILYLVRVPEFRHACYDVCSMIRCKWRQH